MTIIGRDQQDVTVCDRGRG